MFVVRRDIHKFVNGPAKEQENLPFGYEFSYCNFDKHEAVYLPIPLNYIVGWWVNKSFS